jgi:hypothetical protein
MLSIEHNILLRTRRSRTARYTSQGDSGPLGKRIRRVQINEFGAAALLDQGSEEYYQTQPDQLTAPEVFLKTCWSCSADTWNLDMVVTNAKTDALTWSVLTRWFSFGKYLKVLLHSQEWRLGKTNTFLEFDLRN